MNVLVLAEDFYPKTSGGAFTDWKAAREFAERGHRVVVVTPRFGDTAALEDAEGVEIRRPFTAWSEGRPAASLVGMLYRLKFCLLATLYVLRLTRSEQFDVAYVTNHGLHPVGRVLTVWRDLPVVNFIAYSPGIDETQRRLLNPQYLFEQLNIRFCMGEVALCRTPAVREMVSARSDADARLIDGVVRDEALRRATEADGRGKPASDLPTDGPVLLYVGRLSENKNPVAAVEVVAQLPEWRLAVVGDGPARPEVVSAIRRLDVEDRVSLLGQRDHESTLQCIEDADVLLLTSHTEAYPTVVFEALALRTPVVATPVGVLPELSEPRLTLAPVEDMATVVAALQGASGSGIDEDVLARYSVTNFVDQVQDALVAASRPRLEQSPPLAGT